MSLKFLLISGILLAELAAAPCLASIPEVSVERSTPPVEGDRPWNASVDRIVPLKIDALGYDEQEFFVSGTANTYDWGSNGKPIVKARGASYVTRILIRKPKNSAHFSGTVWINPSNPTLGVDMDGLWGCCSKYLARRGDVVVNLTFKPISMRALKAINGPRYQRLTMPNLISPDQRCDISAIVKLDSSMNYLPDQEDGLAWDLFTQIAQLMKKGGSSSPLAHYKVSRVYGYGYSQDANYLRTYLNDFHLNAQALYGQTSPFDGFLLAGGTRTVPINQCSTRSSDTKAKSDGVPVITASTEADANPKLPGLPDGRSAWRPDSDAPNDHYRHYDMAGTVHVGTTVYRTMPRMDAVGNLHAVAPSAVDAIKQVTQGVTEKRDVIEIDQYIFITAMMENLDAWSRTGLAPPPGARFKIGADGTPLLDVNGNAASGLRSPDITVPVATFALRSPGSPPLGFAKYSYVPFLPEKLRELYPNHEYYIQSVRMEAAKLLVSRLITKDGFEDLVQKAKKRKVP